MVSDMDDYAIEWKFRIGFLEDEDTFNIWYVEAFTNTEVETICTTKDKKEAIAFIRAPKDLFL